MAFVQSPRYANRKSVLLQNLFHGFGFPFCMDVVYSATGTNPSVEAIPLRRTTLLLSIAVAYPRHLRRILKGPLHDLLQRSSGMSAGRHEFAYQCSLDFAGVRPDSRAAATCSRA
jgi:hypothetical protein